MDSDDFEEALNTVERGFRRVANAISADAAPGRDAAGGTVQSLTEATMGVTAGLFAIAAAIGDLAEAIREKS